MQPTPTSNRQNKNQTPETKKDIIICFDSNKRFINFRKLWTLDGSKRMTCYTLKSVQTVIRNESAIDVKYFFMNVGVNDIGKNTPEIIIEEYKTIIRMLKEKYPDIKIIISEVTPRKGDLNKDVMKVNKLLAELCENVDFLFLVNHSNLQDKFTLYDDRHIHKRVVPRFAANIKRTLRLAYGHSEPTKKQVTTRNEP